MPLLTYRDALAELTDFLQRFQVFADLELVGSSDHTYFATEDYDRQILLSGWFNDPIGPIQGRWGLSNLSMLDGMFKLPMFNEPGATFLFVTDHRDRLKLSFRDSEGSRYGHDFMVSSIMRNIAQFSYAEYQYDFLCTPAGRRKFKAAAQVATNTPEALSGKKVCAPYFHLFSEKGQVLGRCDGYPSPAVVLGPTEDEIPDSNGSLIFPISPFLAACKAIGGNVPVRIAKGALAFEVELQHSTLSVGIVGRRR